MGASGNKLQKLVDAGLVSDPDKLTPEIKARIETLSDEEITHMVSVKGKLGSDHIKANQGFIFD